MFRIWSNQPNCSPDLLSLLWQDYLEKTRKASSKVRKYIIQQKTKMIFKNDEQSATNTKAYWNTLRRVNKANNYPIKISEPDNPE